MSRTLSDSEYFLAVAEIDYIHFELQRMLDTAENEAAIVKLINAATGYDKELLKQARSLIRRARFLRKKIGLDPQEPTV